MPEITITARRTIVVRKTLSVTQEQLFQLNKVNGTTASEGTEPFRILNGLVSNDDIIDQTPPLVTIEEI